MHMIKRLKKIIEREQIKHPKKNKLSLLINRFAEIQKERYKNWKMLVMKDSTFTSDSEIFMCSLFPKKVLDIVIQDLNPSSVLDVGCGVGKSLEYFYYHKIESIGIEQSSKAIAKSSIKEKIRRHNLKHQINLGRTFDLIWCFEVIEHIHPKYEEVFLRNLTVHGNKILISAAKPGQGGHGHFNEQEPECWIIRFQNLGYKYNEKFSDKVKNSKENHSENLMFFERV